VTEVSPTRRLEGRVAIVTGGGWNVGRAIARRFAAEGAEVVVASRNAANLDETVRTIRAEGGDALAVPTDCTALAEVERLVARTVERHGTVDVLAAIAGGGGGYEPIDTIDPALWERVVRQNLFATFYAVRAVLPILRAKNAGSILTCVGGGAFFPMLGVHMTAYACAKAGVARLTDQLTAELWETGIRVNAIEPGMTWSPETLAKIEADERRTGRRHPDRTRNHPPEHAAELAAFLVSDESLPLRGRLVSTDEDWWRDPAKVRAVGETVHLFRLRRHDLGSDGPTGAAAGLDS
jgi:3-oxoacyl-[acyl-carrier protein] reductase